MRIKRFLFVTILIACCSILVACNNESKKESSPGKDDGKKVIVVGTSASYKPWAFQENDDLKGFEMDVWKEIAKRKNYALEFKLGQFSGLVGMMDAGEIDTVAHQMSITPEREEKYAFSSPYAYSYYDFFVKEDSDFTSKEDLKGKKVGCWLGGNGEATLREIDKKYSLELDIVTYDGAPLEEEVNNGRLDALWQGEVKTNTVIEENDFPLRGLGEKEIYETNAYPFKKDKKGMEIAKEISVVIDDMRDDGTLTKLSEKWFNLDVSDKN